MAFCLLLGNPGHCYDPSRRVLGANFQGYHICSQNVSLEMPERRNSRLKRQDNDAEDCLQLAVHRLPAHPIQGKT